jgi:hypothetical protein
VCVMAPRHTHRRQVDFTSKALLVRVQHQGSDVTPYVQDEGIGWTGSGTWIFERRFFGLGRVGFAPSRRHRAHLESAVAVGVEAGLS